MNIYESVTDRILKQLEAGVIPWRRTWATGIPKSLSTGKEYRGVNILVLGTAEFTSLYWVTYREAQRLGGHVRKGEKASPVVFWKWRTPEELAKRREETGKENLAPCIPFTSAVFNLDQVEGIARPADDVPTCQRHPLQAADRIYELMPAKPDVFHTRTSGPAYAPNYDQVSMPQLGQFETAEEYYATLFHELVHSTGHPKRLSRFGQVDGNRFEQYSFEELVAEFGAAFLCAFAGISNPASEALQASYIDGWSKALRQDSRLIIRAASAAQRATDYIRGQPALPDAVGASGLAAPANSAAAGDATCQPLAPSTSPL